MKKWIAVNLLLLGIAVLIAWQLRMSILRFNSENDVGKIVPVQGAKQKPGQDNRAAAVLPAAPYNPADFTVVSEKNLFSDSRTKEEKVEIIAPPEPPPLAQKPVLVGITIMDSLKTAAIIEPGSTQPPNRPGRAQAQIKKIGDVYQGYTITEIASDHIVLENGTRKETIPLHEGTKRTAGGKTQILATRVVPFGGGAGGGGTVVSGAPGSRTAVAPIGSSVGTTVQPATAQPAGISPVAAPARGAQGQTAAPSARPAPPAQPSDAPTRTIRTPFGDIVRPAR